MERVQRYEWLDALVDAQTAGVIGNGALLFASKLSRAINWKPEDPRKPAGLYWKNGDAFLAVGTSRATYFRVRQSLFETGFLSEKGGNLIPAVPDKSLIETLALLQQSQVETNESHIETEESQVETEESQGDTPFSVDILSGELFSGDVLSEKVEQSHIETGVAFSKIVSPEGYEPSLTAYVVKPQTPDTDGVASEEAAESHLETVQDELGELLDEYEAAAKLQDGYDAEHWTHVRAEARRLHESGTYAHRAIGIAAGWDTP